MSTSDSEMAGYGNARSLAQRLGEHEIAETLQQTLNEEAQADKKLTSIAESQVTVEATSRSSRQSFEAAVPAVVIAAFLKLFREALLGMPTARIQ